MNFGLVRRAIRRHTLMKDRPAYAELLQQVRAHGNVWGVPQADIAAWWERRQRTALHLERLDSRVFRVTCSLAEAAVEVEARGVLIPPFELPTVGTPQHGSTPTYDAGVGDPDLLVEVLGHLGYGHVRPARPGAQPTLSAEELAPMLADLRAIAVRHQRFGPAELSRLRGAVAQAHHHCGLPDLRLWPLPQRGGRAYTVALSVRYDVDAAIGNMHAIHVLENSYGVRSTAYLRPFGYFYGHGEIQSYARKCGGTELALHGEFVTTAERAHGTEMTAAVDEKQILSRLTGVEALGVCMHGGELRSNTTPSTWQAVEHAGFQYETMYRNDFYHPLHLPGEGALRRTLSIGQHFADISVAPGPHFADELASAFIDQLGRAERVAGVFVPVMHPLYFDVAAYLRDPRNAARLAAFVPRIALTALRMRRDQVYANR